MAKVYAEMRTLLQRDCAVNLAIRSHKRSFLDEDYLLDEDKIKTILLNQTSMKTILHEPTTSLKKSTSTNQVLQRALLK